MRLWFVACCALMASSCAHSFPRIPAEPLPKELKLVPPDFDMIGITTSALLAKCGEPDRVVSRAVISLIYYPNMTALVVFVYQKHKKHVFIDPTGHVEYVSDIIK